MVIEMGGKTCSHASDLFGFFSALSWLMKRLL